MRIRWILSLLTGLALTVVWVAGAKAEPETGTETGTETGKLPPVAPKVVAAIENHGSSDFWVLLNAKADLSGADEIANWDERGQFVYDSLTRTAAKSQAGLRDALDAAAVEHQDFWIANQVLVEAGDASTLELARSISGVRSIRADRDYELIEPVDSAKDDKNVGTEAVEWGIQNINADDVWSTYGAHGEGIVVGSIDTGAEFTHPALVSHYRGNLGGGTFNHNYSWWDPAAVCPSAAPCDNNGHGTHTTGTMVGDDGAANHIGVAPGATWIAAKGCEGGSCSSASLLSSGQFMLAPTNLNGGAADPSKRPQVINNSWGAGNDSVVDPWYRSTLTAWAAAGQFGVFSNGNEGPGCDTTGSPADNIEAWGVGAYDISNTIASFSSRGPGESASIRPSISAPGVDVRSSLPGGGYGLLSGTSMAAPHMSGAVALLWSAAPSLIGNVNATRTLFENTAIDSSNLNCGGTADDNNVFGEGRLDVLAAANAAPIGPTGAVAGIVRNQDTNALLQGARAAVGSHVSMTGATGRYRIEHLPIGGNSVVFSKFGFQTRTASANVVNGGTTTLNLKLRPLPTHTVHGRVVAQAQPVQGATVEIVGTPLSATTDAGGNYSIANVPEGNHEFKISKDRCLVPIDLVRAVNGDETYNYVMHRTTDAYGHFCETIPSAWIAGTNLVALSGDDASAAVALPFTFSHYGNGYSSVYVGTNGLLSFTAASAAYTNGSIPSATAPNAAIYPLWDDLNVDASAAIYTRVVGSAPNRRFVIEWRNIVPFSGSDRFDIEVILHEAGRVQLQYRGLNSSRERGDSATVGIENTAGTDALQWSFNTATLSDGTAILFRPPAGTPF